MELDDMKQLWQKMDDSIRQQQTINENIIRRMLQERNSSSLKNMLNMEYLNVVVAVIVLALLLTRMQYIGNGAGLLICYVLSLALLFVGSIMAWFKIKILSNINLATDAVSIVAENTQRFRLLIAKERVLSLVLGPVIIGAFYVTILNLVTGINMFDNITRYLTILVVAIIVYTIGVVILYKKVYFNQIDIITKNLQEIAEFKS